MPGALDKLTIRDAQLSDYDEVVKIGDFFPGNDFVTGMYEQYLKWYKCFVGIIDGEIVAFNGGKLVDEGVTVLTSGARVKVNYQGQGILGQIIRHMMKIFQQISQKLKYDCFTATSDTVSKNRQKIEKNYRQLFTMRNIEMICKLEDFDVNKLPMVNGQQVREILEDDLKTVFQSEKIHQRLFPESRLIINWAAYRILDGNIPYIMSRYQLWSSPTKTTKDSHELVPYGTISISGVFYDGNHLNYCLNFYGNESEIQNHFVFHLKRIPKFVTSACQHIIVNIKSQRLL